MTWDCSSRWGTMSKATPVGDEEDHLVVTSSHFLCSRRQLGRLPGRKQQLPRLVTCSPRCWAATSCHVLHPRWLVAKLQAFLLHYLSNNLSLRFSTSSACKCSRSNWWWQKSMQKLVVHYYALCSGLLPGIEFVTSGTSSTCVKCFGLGLSFQELMQKDNQFCEIWQNQARVFPK